MTEPGSRRPVCRSDLELPMAGSGTAATPACEEQMLMSQLVRLFDVTVENQRQLLETAQDVIALLQESD